MVEMDAVASVKQHISKQDQNQDQTFFFFFCDA